MFSKVSSLCVAVRLINNQERVKRGRQREKNSTYDIKVNDTGDRKLPVEEEGTGMGKKRKERRTNKNILLKY